MFIYATKIEIQHLANSGNGLGHWQQPIPVHEFFVNMADLSVHKETQPVQKMPLGLPYRPRNRSRKLWHLSNVCCRKACDHVAIFNWIITSNIISKHQFGRKFVSGAINKEIFNHCTFGVVNSEGIRNNDIFRFFLAMKVFYIPAAASCCWSRQ